MSTVLSSPFSHYGGDIHRINSELSQKVDKHELWTIRSEISALRSEVGHLESSLRETRTEADGLRDRLDRLEEIERRRET